MGDTTHYVSEFVYGTTDRAAAALIAGACTHFTPDVEEELVAEETESCYNCRFRRWTAASFTCQKQSLPVPYRSAQGCSRREHYS